MKTLYLACHYIVVPRRVILVNYHRLRWASRRGMLELDLILGAFLEKVYPILDDTDQKLFQKLLEREDQELFNWLLNKEVPQETGHARIVNKILEHAGMP